MKIEKESHLLLHVAWKGHLGIIASKIYEYIGSGTKIIIVPGDNSSIDKIITSSKSGVIFNNVDDTFDFICAEYDKYSSNELLSNDYNIVVDRFTRSEQTKVLASIINKVIEN